MAFYSPEGDLVNKVFLTEEEILDNLVGDSLWIWGDNSYGSLGNSTSGPINQKSAPIQLPGRGTSWRFVSVGYSSSAIKTDNTLWLWGRNYTGQLGDNTTIDKSSPVQTISTGSNWATVSLGYASSTGIKTDGTLWTWGRNVTGAIGDNSTINRSSPVQTVSAGTNWKSVSSSASHVHAIKQDSTLWGWGFNGSGELGVNDGSNRSSPTQIAGTDWRYVSSGRSHVSAIKNNYTLWIWGENSFGQLGDNTTIWKSSPVQTVSASSDWKQVACGEYHTAAVKKNGTLWLWGYNQYGRLGDNTTINKSSPVQTISTGSNWFKVAAGKEASFAIKTDGTLWGWGRNGYGNLGDGTVISRSSPVQTVLTGNNWKQVVSYKTTIALTNSQIS